MGFAFMSFLDGRLEKGIKLIIKEIKLEEYMACADIAVTGEGKLDAQSVMGKAPVGIADAAKKYNLPVIAFAGSVDKGASVCNGHGIDAYFSVSHGACTLEDLMKFENAYVNLADEAEQVFRVIRSVRA